MPNELVVTELISWQSSVLQGLTALMCATLAAHMNIIKELLLAKADPMLKRKVIELIN